MAIRKHRRLIVGLLGLCVGSLAGGASSRGAVAQEPDREPASGASNVEVQNALLKTIESTHVAAEVAGRIHELTVREGAAVTADQLLGKIRDAAIQLQTEQSKIAVEIARKKQRNSIDLQLARKKHEVAQNELERAVTANQRIANTYGPKEVDRLQLVADSTHLEIERAKHVQEVAELELLLAENAFRQSEELLARHQIQSPVVGVVVAIHKRVGEWVEPGTELLEIVRIDRLRIEGFVSTTAANQQLVDRQANVTVLTGGEELPVRGEVVFVSPDANPVNGLVRIHLEIENRRGNFRPGMRVKAAIVGREMPRAAEVPDARPPSDSETLQP